MESRKMIMGGVFPPIVLFSPHSWQRAVKYKTNITVLIQYKDTFNDVGNILASSSQKFQRRELIVGIPFGIETRKKEIEINKTLNSLLEIENEIKRALQKNNIWIKFIKDVLLC